MIRTCSCLVLAAAFQVIFGQAEQSRFRPPPHGFQRQSMAVPNHCLAPPNGVNLHKCCPIPRIFSEEDMERCDIEKVSNSVKLTQTPPKPKGPCQESKCLLQNADLLLANQSVDYEKLRAFVDKWAGVDPNFTEAINGAKKVCAHDGGPSGPPVCESDRIFICLTSNVLWNCKLQDLDGENGCRILKEHMDECRPFYYTQSEEEALLSRKL